MKPFGRNARPWWLPACAGIVAAGALWLWFGRGPGPLGMRVPGTDHAPGDGVGGAANAVLAGKLITGDGQPAALPGNWPQFRGPERDGVGRDVNPVGRSVPASGWRELWSIEVGEGYAGPAVADGRVYLMDYDRDKKQDALRCLSLADGRELWRYAYPVAVKRNHGMSRTVPTVASNVVVAMGPKCHVVCADATTGQLRWGLDLVRQFGATVPPWYAGQCPLVEGDAAILAPGGPEALMIAVKLGSTNPALGEVVWQTPNTNGWKMTHSSIMPLEFEGERMYVYCADKGVAGVSAQTGALLWETTDWKISLATVPSPLPLPGGRIFLSGGYNAGSLMLQLKKEGGRFVAETAFRLPPEKFGATQQTPIFHNDHIYGVRPDGKFVCLDPAGKTIWASASGQQFGLGPFLLAQGLIFAVNDSGLMRLIEASPDKYNLLGEARILQGRESWGPLALAGGRLLARDLTRMVCLEVGAPESLAAAAQ